jgi:hypothetical protein
MSVSAKVILLVRHDETLYDLIEFGTLRVYRRTNEKIDSRITKNSRAFRRLIPF